MEDIRDHIFASIIDREFQAVLSPESPGCISGIEQMILLAQEIGVTIQCLKKEGDLVAAQELVARMKAKPKQLAIAEERLIGVLAKYSGIATASRRAVDLAQNKLRIVCGSWKKMPPEIKNGIRSAICTGGASFRITDTPMVYLDKNFIRMFGSISQTLEAVKDLTGYTKVVQIRGETDSIEAESHAAIEGCAGILMVDTGRPADLEICLNIVKNLQARKKVQVAYAGGILLDDIPRYCAMGVDMLCIGKEIVDAPLLDMKLDVVPETGEQ